MMRANHRLRYACFAILIIITMGCSGGGNPVEPVEVPAALAAETEFGSERMLWGMWDIYFDPAEMNVSAIPLRIANPHFDITEMVIPPACDDCLAIAVNSFDPVTRILDADVTLSNPFPISGRDVRGIFMTNDLGHELRNPDDWTKLWDIPGGQTLNPFKAFAKSETNRQFSGGTEHTENYLVYIPQPPQYAAIRFAVDASWPSNCKEPYSIENFVVLDDIYNVLGTSCIVEVNVHDWQDDVTGVTLVLPEITGESFTGFSHIGGTLWRLELINNGVAGAGDYEGRIIASSPNAQDLALYDYVTVTVTIGTQPVVTSLDPDSAQAGADLSGVILTGSDFQGPDATVLLRKTGEMDITGTNVVVVDENTITFDMSIHPLNGLGMYDIRMTDDTGLVGLGSGVFEVLEPVPDNPVDITPPWLNFSPVNITVEGDFVYISARGNGMHIFWILSPTNPIWIAKVDAGDEVRDVAIDGNYAYLADCTAGIQIVDITNPHMPNVVKILDTPDIANAIDAYGGYAYASVDSDLVIIDVEPPADASIIETIPLTEQCDDVDVHNGYVYLAVSASSVVIVDVDPPGSASIVHTVVTPGYTMEIDIEGNYVYIVEGDDGFSIIDITTPESASIVKTVPGNSLQSCAVSGGYGYVASESDGLLIVDVDLPGDAYVVETIDCNPGSEGVSVDYADGYAYFTDQEAGLFVVDVSNPGSSSIVGKAETAGNARNVYFDNGMAYVANGEAGLAIVDVFPPENAYYVKGVETSSALDVKKSGGYAYVADWDDGLHIIDVDPPQSAFIFNTLVLPEGTTSVDVYGTYAYVASFGDNLYIIDIDPPESASIENNVPTGAITNDVDAVYGYAYVTAHGDGMHIVDTDPIGSASIINTVPTSQHAKGIFAWTEYAYVAEGFITGSFEIIDINPPGAASVIKTIPLVLQSYDVTVSDGYAYVANDEDGLVIIDVDPPASASIVGTLDTPGRAKGVFVTSYYAYVADASGGLRIIRLW